jgi:hypothetical protein
MLLKGLPIVLVASASAGAAEIDHPPVACILEHKLSEIEAQVRPAGASARVYFRGNNAPYWSSVAMTGPGEGQKAVLPKAESGAREMYYYIEAKDASGASRTTEFLAEVVAKKELCPDPARLAKAVEGPSPAVERGSQVTLTHSEGGSGKGRWIAIGVLAAGAAGTGVAVASHSQTPGPTIPNGTYHATLAGYNEVTLSNCNFTLTVPAGGTLTITVSGDTATATFDLGQQVTFLGPTSSACPLPTAPPLSGSFASLTVKGTGIGGATSLGSETLTLTASVENGVLQGTIDLKGGPPQYAWTGASVPFSATRAN